MSLKFEAVIEVTRGYHDRTLEFSLAEAAGRDDREPVRVRATVDEEVGLQCRVAMSAQHNGPNTCARSSSTSDRTPWLCRATRVVIMLKA